MASPEPDEPAETPKPKDGEPEPSPRPKWRWVSGRWVEAPVTGPPRDENQAPPPSHEIVCGWSLLRRGARPKPSVRMKYNVLDPPPRR